GDAPVDTGSEMSSVPAYALGSEPGQQPQVQVFNATGQTLFTFLAYDKSYTGGVKATLADMNGDSVPDIVTTPTGTGPTGRVFDGDTGKFLYGFDASRINDSGTPTVPFTPENFATRKPGLGV